MYVIVFIKISFGFIVLECNEKMSTKTLVSSNPNHQVLNCDIKPIQNKSLTSTSSQQLARLENKKQDETFHDIFLSFEKETKWFAKELLKKLRDQFRFKTWMLENCYDNTKMYQETTKVISNSKLFLCCINKRYAISENCIFEINYANLNKKPFIVVMLDKSSLADLGSVGQIISNLVKFSLDNEKSAPLTTYCDLTDVWCSNVFVSMIKFIKANLLNEKNTMQQYHNSTLYKWSNNLINSNMNEVTKKDGIEKNETCFINEKAIKDYEDGKYVGDLLNDKRNGRGIFHWKDGKKYEGQWFNDTMNGRGTLYLPDGDIYVGDFLNGKENGKGTYTWSNGDQYEGDWLKGQRLGSGTYNWSNGDRYVGEFLDEKKNGKGVYFYKNGNRYEGEFFNDEKHNKGVLFYINGDKYVGSFSRGKRHGKGVYEHRNGDKYEGEWHDDKKNGSGIYFFINRDRYVGEFSNDFRGGKGIFYSKNGDRYEGEWLNDLKHGRGTLLFADGDKYDGEFMNDKRHGRGTFFYKSGSKYEGEWLNDKKNGHGIILWTNSGDRYEGEWLNGKKHGKGTYFFKDGRKYEGDWFNDQRV